jgi:16S rRNA (uracil1498-N3)-methyltransferase
MTLRIHVPGPWPVGEPFDLPAEAARHVQVRRLQPGQALRLFGRGLPGDDLCEWPAEVVAMGRQHVTVRAAAPEVVDRELALRVTLQVVVPANDRMDDLVEKATELGVYRIEPTLSERSVLRLDGERAQRKVMHWQAVAAAAAGQCGRTRVPEVASVASLDQRCRDAAVAVPQASRWVLQVTPAARPDGPAAGSVVVLSGPEGGLSPAELAMAQASGYRAVNLGPRVLRADTAPLAVLAWLGLGAA